jgi:hypothetical protein
MPRVRFTADITARDFSAAVFEILCVGWKMSQKFLVPVSKPFTSRKQSIYSLVNSLKTIWIQDGVLLADMFLTDQNIFNIRTRQ